MNTKDVALNALLVGIILGIWSNSYSQHLPTEPDCDFVGTGPGNWGQLGLEIKFPLQTIDRSDDGVLASFDLYDTLTGIDINSQVGTFGTDVRGTPTVLDSLPLGAVEVNFPVDIGIDPKAFLELGQYFDTTPDVVLPAQQPFNCIETLGSSTVDFFEDSCPTCYIIGGDNATNVGALQVSTNGAALGARWLGGSSSGSYSSASGHRREGLQTILDATVLLVTKISSSTKSAFFPCTGTLFASGAILTAGHCMSWIAGASQLCGDSVEVEQIIAIGADAVPFAVEVPERLPCLPTSKDFLLLNVARDHSSPERLEWVAQVGLPATAVHSPLSGQRLLSIQYRYEKKRSDPTNNTYIMSRMVQTDDCSVLLVLRSYPLFFHQCDTAGASSGSLLFDYAELAIVGMHVAGHSRSLNRGIDINEIQSSLKPESANLFR